MEQDESGVGCEWSGVASRRLHCLHVRRPEQLAATRNCVQETPLLLLRRRAAIEILCNARSRAAVDPGTENPERSSTRRPAELRLGESTTSA